ncbi:MULTISPECIES: efflux RND transporter periplasmic adaptor subunit [unclassified Myroides]|uniref:efflux RND transporter periplasmic adaptor subunit n=1 Tax=unclassified Myroides TaxID=2642485 RepID=UPI0015F9BB2A|nr:MULTISPECIES: efflux RND transporter periplasmic adaptor subunit [unclassified Myroides]MBB1150305.1 efflux RND transporter periplasmic adaptor subunit [Myroides sp. NP-2]MDM1408025.1 efflux RND transporter periplasmic adaptor subunit [Myroides sp. DF42-4-2]
MKRYFILSIVVLGSAVLATACKDQATVETTETKPKTTVDLSTSPIRELNPSYSITLPGEINPYEQVALHAKVSGFIKQLYVDRGDYVRKGQLLALLEAPEMNQRALSDRSIQDKAYSDYLLAKQVYDRLVEASKTTGAVAQIELDRAQSSMNSAKSAFESAKASTAQANQLQDYLRIVAPFDGIITQRNLSTGSLVGNAANQPIFEMAQNDKLRLTLSIPEKHAGSIPEAATATFSISSYPGEVFTAKLSRSSGVLNSKDRSLTLEFDIDNKDRKLQGGDYAQVKLNLQRKQPTLWVATKSILNTQSGNFVITKKTGDELARIPVELGVQMDSITEVFGSLQASDLVINKPSEDMKNTKK